MADDRSEESQHFEQVLTRLDALMKRNQLAESTSTTWPESPFDHDAAAPDDETLELILPPPENETPVDGGISIDSHDVIPVLTEVYEVVLPSPAGGQDAPDLAIEIEAVIDAAMPRIQAIIDQAVASEMENMRAALLPRIQEAVAATLRNRLPEDHGESD